MQRTTHIALYSFFKNAHFIVPTSKCVCKYSGYKSLVPYNKLTVQTIFLTYLGAHRFRQISENILGIIDKYLTIPCEDTEHFQEHN